MPTAIQAKPSSENQTCQPRIEGDGRRSAARWHGRHIGLICTMTALLLIASTSSTESVVAESPQAEHEALQLVQRLFQYEVLLGVPISLETGICIDTQLGQRWRLPNSKNQEGSRWQQVSEKVRIAAEECLPPESNELRGMTKELRLTMENQLGKRALQEKIDLARRCITKSADLASLKSCAPHAGDQDVSGKDWKRWVIIYESRARQ